MTYLKCGWLWISCVLSITGISWATTGGGLLKIRSLACEHQITVDGRQGMRLTAEVVTRALPEEKVFTSFMLTDEADTPIRGEQGKSKDYVDKTGEIYISDYGPPSSETGVRKATVFIPYDALAVPRRSRGQLRVTVNAKVGPYFARREDTVMVPPSRRLGFGRQVIEIVDVSVMPKPGTTDITQVVAKVRVQGLRRRQAHFGVMLETLEGEYVKAAPGTPKKQVGLQNKYTTTKYGSVDYDKTIWKAITFEVPHRYLELEAIKDGRVLVTLYVECNGLMHSMVSEARLWQPRTPVVPEETHLVQETETFTPEDSSSVSPPMTPTTTDVTHVTVPGIEVESTVDLLTTIEEKRNPQLVQAKVVTEPTSADTTVSPTAVTSTKPSRLPTAQQEVYLKRLARFDDLYKAWCEGSITEFGNTWDHLSTVLHEGVQGATLSGADGPFILRCLLAEGEACLFAAVAYYEAGHKAKAVQLYSEGIYVLDRVLREVAKDSTLDRFPPYTSKGYVIDGRLHPYAGYESIATGMELTLSAVRRSELNRRTDAELPGLAPDTRVLKRMTDAVRGTTRYAAIVDQHESFSQWMKNHQADTLDKNLSLNEQFWITFGAQVTTTSEMAKRFLTDFCPWGVELYFLWREAGLLDAGATPLQGLGLDYRILRPFSSTHTTWDSMGALFTGYEGPPVVSEITIAGPKIPMHVSDEMSLIMGDRKQGYLDPLRKRHVGWNWVGKKPTYTIRFLSPRVYDPTIAEQFGQALKMVKLIFGGPADVAVDEALAKLLNTIGSYYGKDGGIYAVSQLLVEGNDKGVITTNMIEKEEGPSRNLIVKKLAGLCFKALQTYIDRGLYETIAPRALSLGKSYDGSLIPAVLIRGDILGFKKVPDDRYEQNLQPVRFYNLLPSFLVSSTYRPYDLTKKENWSLARSQTYLSEQRSFPGGSPTMAKELLDSPRSVGSMENVRKWSWKEVQAPHGYQDYVTNFHPRLQKIRIELTRKLHDQLDKKNSYRVVLQTIDTPSITYCDTYTLGGNSVTQFEIYDPNAPGTTAAKEKGERQFQGRTVGTVEAIRHWHSSRSFKLTPRCQYCLKITQGGRTFANRTLSLSRGWRNKREINGQLRSYEKGVVNFVYQAEADEEEERDFFVYHHNQILKERKLFQDRQYSPSKSSPFRAFPQIRYTTPEKIEKYRESHGNRMETKPFNPYTAWDWYRKPFLLELRCHKQLKYCYVATGSLGWDEDYDSVDGWGSDCFYGLPDGLHKVQAVLYSSEGFQKHFTFTIQHKQASVNTVGKQKYDAQAQWITQTRQTVETYVKALKSATTDQLYQLLSKTDYRLALSNGMSKAKLRALLQELTLEKAKRLRDTLIRQVDFEEHQRLSETEILASIQEAFALDEAHCQQPSQKTGSLRFMQTSTRLLRPLSCEGGASLMRKIANRYQRAMTQSEEHREVLIEMFETVAHMEASRGNFDKARSVLTKHGDLLKSFGISPENYYKGNKHCRPENWPQRF